MPKLTIGRLLVLSNQAEEGVLFDGPLRVSLGDESLGHAALRTLRQRGVGIQNGDCMFFPDAAPKHRLAEIEGHDISRVQGWYGQ